MPVDGRSEPDGDQRALVTAAETLLVRAPELALVFARRAGAGGALAGAVEASALVRLGRCTEAVWPALAVLTGRTGPALPEAAAARLRIDVAACASTVGAPRVALTVLRPVLESDQPPGVRADALVRYAACLARLDRRAGVEGVHAEADRLLSADRALDPDERRVRRALVCVHTAAHLRYRGDAALAIAAAREGLALLDRLSDPAADGGLARPWLVSEVVHALLDQGDRDVARTQADALVSTPVRAGAASAVSLVMLAMATRVHLPAGRDWAGRALLTEAVRLGERHRTPVLAEALTALAHAHEQDGSLADALECLRAARAAEHTARVAAEQARAALTDVFGLGEAPAPGRGVPGAAAPVAGRQAEPTAVSAPAPPTMDSVADSGMDPAGSGSARELPEPSGHRREPATRPRLSAPQDVRAAAVAPPLRTPTTPSEVDSGGLSWLRSGLATGHDAATAGHTWVDTARGARRAEPATGGPEPDWPRAVDRRGLRRKLAAARDNPRPVMLVLVQVDKADPADEVDPVDRVDAVAGWLSEIAPADAELTRPDDAELAVLLPDATVGDAERFADTARDTVTGALPGVLVRAGVADVADVATDDEVLGAARESAHARSGTKPANDLLAGLSIRVGSGGRRRAPDPAGDDPPGFSSGTGGTGGTVPEPPDDPDEYPAVPTPGTVPRPPEPDPFPAPPKPDSTPVPEVPDPPGDPDQTGRHSAGGAVDWPDRASEPSRFGRSAVTGPRPIRPEPPTPEPADRTGVGLADLLAEALAAYRTGEEQQHRTGLPPSPGRHRSLADSDYEADGTTG